MHVDEKTEKIINMMVPVAIFLGTYLIVSIIGDTWIEIYIQRKLESPLFVVFGFSVIFAVYLYCIYYSKNKLGYFTDMNKFNKHLLLMIIIPAALGIFSGYKSYKTKKPAVIKQAQLDRVKKHDSKTCFRIYHT